MEHMIAHETVPLKEEKLLIREMKQLKQVREQLSSNIGSHDELQQALNNRDQIEERLKVWCELSSLSLYINVQLSMLFQLPGWIRSVGIRKQLEGCLFIYFYFFGYCSTDAIYPPFSAVSMFLNISISDREIFTLKLAILS